MCFNVCFTTDTPVRDTVTMETPKTQGDDSKAYAHTSDPNTASAAYCSPSNPVAVDSRSPEEGCSWYSNPPSYDSIAPEQRCPHLYLNTGAQTAQFVRFPFRQPQQVKASML